MRRKRSTPTRVNAATTAGSSLAVLIALAGSAGAEETRDIKELGVVRSAVIAYPPYTHVKPTIVLEVAGGKMRFLGPGDAIEYKPHPLHGEIVLRIRRGGRTVELRFDPRSKEERAKTK